MLPGDLGTPATRQLVGVRVGLTEPAAFRQDGVRLFNALDQNECAPVPQGVAGELYGLPIMDANMVTTAKGAASFSGSGGTQDPVVVLKEDDLTVWEGTMRLRALPEILTGTLQVRYQAYAYSAFLPTALPTVDQHPRGRRVRRPGLLIDARPDTQPADEGRTALVAHTGRGFLPSTGRWVSGRSAMTER
jgi:hypothetical protein